ncbi:MAG: hypothetical protein HWQ42_07435 [Nostoc sp. JL23]|nr:hypothetical protein [Nostoc sp. JL23]
MKYPNIVLEYLNIILKYLNIVLEYLNIVLEYSNIVLEYPNIVLEYPNIVLEYLNIILKYLNIAIAPGEAKCDRPLKPLAVLFPVSDWECRPRGSASLVGGRAAIEVHFQPRGWKRDLKVCGIGIPMCISAFTPSKSSAEDLNAHTKEKVGLSSPPIFL